MKIVIASRDFKSSGPFHSEGYIKIVLRGDMLKIFNILLFLMIFAMFSANSMDFGNVAIYRNVTFPLDTCEISVQLRGDSEQYFFNNNGEIIIWNVHPGRNVLVFNLNENMVPDNIVVDVYPGLTNKIVLITTDGQYEIVNDGFADQAGHIIAFNRDEINNFPGDIRDGLVIFKSDKIRTGHKYLTTESKLRDGTMGVFSIAVPNENSYDGLLYSSSLPQSGLTPITTFMHDKLLINNSDPMAGYSNSEFSFISGFGGPANMGIESSMAITGDPVIVVS
jgi:hypothetical protein